jgi:thiamine biosynthesis protein ThiS
MKIKRFYFNIFLNGKLYLLYAYKRFSLNDIKMFFKYEKSLVILEYNNKIIHPENWSYIILKDFDKIEVLTIVGGG